MKSLLLCPVLVFAACSDHKVNFGSTTPCGDIGEHGQYYLGYSDNVILFPHCYGIGHALAPDGAVASITYTAANPGDRQSKHWIGARSSDENVMSAAFGVPLGLTVKTNHPGRAFLELYDDSMQTVERAEVVVESPQSVQVTGLPAGGASVPLLAGSSVFIEYRAAGQGEMLLGIGGGTVETAGPLQILTPPSASFTYPVLANFDPTSFEVGASQVGDGTATVHMADASAVVPIQIVDVAELSSAKLSSSTLGLSATGRDASVYLFAYRDTTPIYGARCQWNVPAGIDVQEPIITDRLGSAPGTAYYFSSTSMGSYTATCVMSPSISLSLQIVVGD